MSTQTTTHNHYNFSLNLVLFFIIIIALFGCHLIDDISRIFDARAYCNSSEYLTVEDYQACISKFTPEIYKDKENK